MKSILLVFLIATIPIRGNSQTKIDSIDLLIAKAISDTDKINLQNWKLSLLNESNLDSAVSFGLEVVKEARRAHYIKGEADALVRLSFAYSLKGQYALAREMLLKTGMILEETKDSTLYSKMYGAYGNMYGIQGKYDSAIQVFEKAVRISEGLDDQEKLGNLYGNMAICYQQIADFPSALSYQIKSLKLANEANNISAQAHTLLNMGITYSEMEDFTKAEKYILEAVNKAESINSIIVQVYGFSNLASNYFNTQDWQKAYDYAMKAAGLAKQMGDVGIESASLSKAAEGLARLNKYEQAEALGKKSLILADSSGQPVNIMQTYNTMGNILSLQSRYRESIPYYEQARNSSLQLDAYNRANATYLKELSLSYEKTGSFEKALKTYKNSAEITDSIRRKENIMKATTLSMNYEFEKKQNQLKAEQDIKDAAAKTKQLIILGTAGFIFILALFAWRAMRNKQKANRKLMAKNTEIRNTLKKLRETQAQLIQWEKMASMGELTAGIAHEIQNPLNFVNNFSELNGELIEELLKARKKEVRNVENEEDLLKDIKENEGRINYHGKRADAIVKSMLQHSRKSTGQKEPTDINSLADEYLRLSYHGLRAKDKSFNVNMHTNFDQGMPKLNIIPQEMGRVFLNLFNNAFYAVTEKRKSDPGFDPAVNVSTSFSPEWAAIIKIKDNGIGIPKQIIDKIFQPFFTTKPTKEGTGLGLSLSYDIVKAHGGTFEVNTEEGEFTEFIIRLPGDSGNSQNYT